MAARSRNLDPHRAAHQFPAVEFFDGALAVAVINHFDESEAARAPVETVAHDFGALDRADFEEGLAKLLIRERKIQIADKQTHAHFDTQLQSVFGPTASFRAGRLIGAVPFSTRR